MPLLRSVVASILLLAFSHPTLSQSPSIRIASVSEPPELMGEPKKFNKPSDADHQLYDIIGHLKDAEETKSTLPKLDDFITQHPDNSDAYFLRATCTACILNSNDFVSISSDVKAAMSHSLKNIYNDTDYYSLLGKIAFASSQYGQAMDDLEKAMSRDLNSADKMFNIGGVEAEKTSQFCTWNLTDLDALAAKFPNDYRAWLYRGLYYEFFATFKEEYYPKALPQFQRAAVLNPRSPLPPYFIGQLYSKASFWTKKAWASDAGRDEATKSAIQAYTKAIQLDPKFWPAYEMRASGYLNLKEYPQAIKDYDKILALDPKNDTAYSDGGIAKLESGKFFAAITDFGEAIRLKNPGDSFLSDLYQYRGDAYVDLGGACQRV